MQLFVDHGGDVLEACRVVRDGASCLVVAVDPRRVVHWLLPISTRRFRSQIASHAAAERATSSDSHADRVMHRCTFDTARMHAFA